MYLHDRDLVEKALTSERASSQSVFVEEAHFLETMIGGCVPTAQIQADRDGSTIWIAEF